VVAIPEPVRADATRQIEAFCEQRVPAVARDDMRLEFELRANAVTIVERPPPWNPEYGPDWSSLKIAQLRYDPDAATWSLYYSDRNERWHRYPRIRPSRDVAALLAAVDADPTGIFWG
jgi:Protein of unknown function (DUF3024)